jgi:hypothetical protein
MYMRNYLYFVGVSFAGGIRRGDSSGRGQNAGGLLAAVARSKAALSRQKAIWQNAFIR